MDKYRATQWLSDRIIGDKSELYNHVQKLEMLKLLAEINGWIKNINLYETEK